MRLRELERFLDIDVEGSLEERFMDNEDLYVRFLRKLVDSTHFADMEAALAADDYEGLLRHAHNLKGVCANLGLNGMSEALAGMVSLLRGGCRDEAQLNARMEELKDGWQKVLTAVKEL